LLKWIIFISPWQLNLFVDADHWYVDGTFYSVPQGYYQLINISTYHSISNLYIPLLWAITTHKSYDMYMQLFLDIAKLLPSLKKIRITVDFEAKLIEALKSIFDCQILGCFYHFSECLRRKAQKLGLLTSKYEEETNQIIKKFKGYCFSQTDIQSNIINIENEYQIKIKSHSANSVDQERKVYYDGILIYIFYNITYLQTL